MSDSTQAPSTLTTNRATDAAKGAFESFVASVDGVKSVTQVFPEKEGDLERWYVVYVVPEKAAAALAALKASPLVELAEYSAQRRHA